MSDQFVVHRLRAKPVEYSVDISHFVRDGKWVMQGRVNNIAETKEDMLRVAGDLRALAQWLEEDFANKPSIAGFDPNPTPPLPKA